jgi:hypothetical protein
MNPVFEPLELWNGWRRSTPPRKERAAGTRR